MLKKSAFFDFFSRHQDTDFEKFMRASKEDEHYINWHDFALPNDYGGAELEYRAIRNRCAMYDVSPIRKYRIRGAGAGAFLDHLVTRPVSNAPSMRAIYVAFCNDDGNLRDDSILYKYADDDYLLLPAETDHDEHFESLRRRLEIDDVSIVECTASLAGISLQGPLSATVLHRWGFEAIEKLQPFEVRDYELAGGSMRISRLGFTADLGYECLFEPELCSAFEEGILSVSAALGIDIPGYGVGAMEACRLEGGFIVPGWDCANEYFPNPGFERSPFELGLGWLVNLNAADFVGRDALRENKRKGHRYALRSFEIDTPHMPEAGAELCATWHGKDVKIGLMPCRCWSWGMERTIGHASIERQYADLEQGWTTIGNQRLSVKLTRGPLINLPRRTQTPAPIDESI
jgi:aminomethyltransferase